MLSTVGMLIIPGMLWGWAFYHLQRYKHSNLKLLFVLFLFGMISGLIALVLNHSVEKYTLFWSEAPPIAMWGTMIPLHSIVFWVLVGMNEEFAKLFMLLLCVYPSRYIQEPFDGIIYIAIIALGFATIENLFYFQQYGVTTLISRATVTIPAHAFMSVPMGYWVARSHILAQQTPDTFEGRAMPMLLILKGWFYSAFLHGSYDIFLSTKLEGFAYLQIFLMGFLTLALGRYALKQSNYLPATWPVKICTFENKR